MATSGQLPRTYDPHQVEEKWYSFWEEKQLFRPEVEPAQDYFSMVIPPPNVTGALHMGHALNNTLQDVVTRWQRMTGRPTLWLPGMDHAGIATQARVVESLAQEGLTPQELGREAFLERTWAWKERYGGQIIGQLKRLGASCDWSRERFTMDEGCSRAVREVFVSLYEKGLIYQGNYIVNWCPHCHTALSDIEVEHEEVDSHLWHVSYPRQDGQGQVVVATTRPETILGDTAVAVHPQDDRYRDLVGQKVVLPVLEREIPVVADAFVDPEFGSGAVKVTPAHDPNDFQMGVRHDLEFVVVIDKLGFMTAAAGPYQGQDRFECRKKLVEELQRRGNLVQVEDYRHAVGHCSRCTTTIEPLLSRQWFVRMEPLARPAIEAVQQGDIEFIPPRFTRVYTEWLQNIRDWCISRQLWWGHRIPVWYCQNCQKQTASRTDVESCPSCGGQVEQDPDVLDTWFSSALWPFSTLGWPEKTRDLEYFYPTSLLITGRDIIFFWVARMIFMGLEFMRREPFRQVLIHGLVLDARGRKMSKSLGNGIDPLEVIELYGADTLRFMLVTGISPGNDMRFHWERVEGCRNFANKLWNAARFVLMNLQEVERPLQSQASGELTSEDRWILSRRHRMLEEVNSHLEGLHLGEAATCVYEFVWNEFCDWYIEMVKHRLYEQEEKENRGNTARWVLARVLDDVLRLLHPFMPFITEEIWQYLRPDPAVESITVSSWPGLSPGDREPELEGEMQQLMEMVRAVRNLRAEMGVEPGRRARVVIMAPPEQVEAVRRLELPLQQLAQVEPLEVYPMGQEKPGQAAVAVVGALEVFLPLPGLIDLEREISRLQKECRELEEEVKRARKKLDNPSFVNKAPPEIVAREQKKEEEYLHQWETVAARLQALQEMGGLGGQ